jgi:hypothetical protein
VVKCIRAGGRRCGCDVRSRRRRGETGAGTALENARLFGDRPYTKEKADCWTRWRTFAQVRCDSNIQLLPFALVTVPSMVMHDLKTTLYMAEVQIFQIAKPPLTSRDAGHSPSSPR